MVQIATVPIDFEPFLELPGSCADCCVAKSFRREETTYEVEPRFHYCCSVWAAVTEYPLKYQGRIAASHKTRPISTVTQQLLPNRNNSDCPTTSYRSSKSSTAD